MPTGRATFSAGTATPVAAEKLSRKKPAYLKYARKPSETAADTAASARLAPFFSARPMPRPKPQPSRMDASIKITYFGSPHA